MYWHDTEISARDKDGTLPSPELTRHPEQSEGSRFLPPQSLLLARKHPAPRSAPDHGGLADYSGFPV